MQVFSLPLGAGGGRSHFFRLRLRSCFKIFESGFGSGNFSNLRIGHLFRLRVQSRQPKITNGFTSQMTMQTPATADIEVSQDRAGFSKIFDSGVQIRKKNAESCRSRLQHSGSVATSAGHMNFFSHFLELK